MRKSGRSKRRAEQNAMRKERVVEGLPSPYKMRKMLKLAGEPSKQQLFRHMTPRKSTWPAGTFNGMTPRQIKRAIRIEMSWTEAEIENLESARKLATETSAELADLKARFGLR